MRHPRGPRMAGSSRSQVLSETVCACPIPLERDDCDRLLRRPLQVTWPEGGKPLPQRRCGATAKLRAGACPRAPSKTRWRSRRGFLVLPEAALRAYYMRLEATEVAAAQELVATLEQTGPVLVHRQEREVFPLAGDRCRQSGRLGRGDLRRARLLSACVERQRSDPVAHGTRRASAGHPGGSLSNRILSSTEVMGRHHPWRRCGLDG